MGVEIVLDRIVVRRSRDDNEVGVRIGRGSVEGRRKVEFLFREILFDVFVLNRGNPVVDFLDLFRNHVNSRYLVVLRQESRDTQTDISGASYCDFHFMRLE